MEETGYMEYEEIPEEGAPETSGDNSPDDMPDISEDIPAEDGVDPAPGDQDDPGDIEDRLGDLLEQIGAGQDLGSMGDYYIPDAGCYAFPTEEVFFHFIAEAERSAWTTASNGCHVPAGSLEAYEAYLSTGSPETDEGEQLPPPLTTEDLAGIEDTLQAIHGEDAVFYETATLFMESTEKALEDEKQLFSNIYVVGLVISFFLAFFCGAYVADVFWKRMRAG